jgi:pyridoxine 4-dehydrogenase
MPQSTSARLAGTWDLGGSLINRMGFGAMQLAGPGVWGPPDDPDAAAAVLRGAIELGVNHIDTSDYYGPYTVNELIRATLHPYPDDLVIVTKVGARRSADKGWHEALSAAELTQAVHDNLRRLAVDVLDVVNLRVGGIFGPGQAPLAEPWSVLAGLREQGLIRNLGVSNVTAGQLAEAQAIAPVVCVQNNYSVANRGDDDLIDLCAAQAIAYTPFFPLGGFQPLQSEALDAAAVAVGATSRQVALAWLLGRSPNVLLIPGTSSVAHLEDNVAAGGLELPDAIRAELDAIG